MNEPKFFQLLTEYYDACEAVDLDRMEDSVAGLRIELNLPSDTAKEYVVETVENF